MGIVHIESTRSLSTIRTIFKQDIIIRLATFKISIFVWEHILQIKMGKLLHILIVSVWSICIWHELRSLESWIEISILDFCKNREVVRIQEIASIFSRYQNAGQDRRGFAVPQVHTSADSLYQFCLRNTFVHQFQAMLYRYIFLTRSNLLGSRNLDKGKISLAITIERGQQITFLKNTVQVDFIVHTLSHFTICHGKVEIIRTAYLDLHIQVTLGTYLFQFTFLTIGISTHLPFVGQLRLISIISQFWFNNDIFTQVKIVCWHGRSIVPLDG